jgi:hypothetical protein
LERNLNQVSYFSITRPALAGEGEPAEPRRALVPGNISPPPPPALFFFTLYFLPFFFEYIYYCRIAYGQSILQILSCQNTTI